ncbi:MAG: endonuclease III [Clostridiales bacterium]|nr:endonuclease III [Clostridiales bacterium]
MVKKNDIPNILNNLRNDYQEVSCTLDYVKPLDLLVATMLSAQCTDARVNIVTPKLFEKYRNINDFAQADYEELQTYIKSTGFFRNKSTNIMKCCQKVLKEYNGEIPDTIDELVKLPGVGRKTANVFLSEIHNTPGIIVDTHAKRLSRRIGLTKEEDPVKIERDLMKKIPKDQWSEFSHRMVYHGRAVCNARKPDCENCSIKQYCDYYKNKQ